MKLSAIWQVEGALTTVAPMHVGDGRAAKAQGEEVGEIQTAAKTLDGRARIPGASLKGVVRGGFTEADARGDGVFGVEQQGGLVQFLDSYSEQKLDWGQMVLGRTGIDAVTGAAQDNLLFHLEVVPVETRFRVRIRGKAFDGQRWEDLAALVDLGMRRFNGGDIRLGAGESNGWGKCTWSLDAVRVMDAAARAAWLEKPEPLDVVLGTLENRKAEVPPQATSAISRSKRITLVLRFDGHPFLVNGPKEAAKKGQEKNAHAARRTADGKLLLPAESFRGVLAHQAERIARTRDKSGERADVARDAAGELPARDALTRLFGAAGWGSAIELSDFVEASQPGKRYPASSYVQEFLAVDRFTGGGSEERKFDAEGGWEPVLSGTLTVNLERLQCMGQLEPALGLLALTLRDMAEGDMTFGWGSGKGYGWARVETGEVTAVHWVEKTLENWGQRGVANWIEAWENENG